MATATMTKQKLSLTLSRSVTLGIKSDAKDQKVSRSALVDQILDEYLRHKKEKEMREGYKALRDVSRSIVGGYRSLQEKAIQDY